MADIVKVKAKKNYEWHQDSKYLYVKISMPGHTSIKNVEIYLSDFVLRVTSKVKKNVETLDFRDQIDYLSSENKFTLIDSTVHATLKKKQHIEKWESLLVEGITLKELTERRKQSEQRYQENIHKLEQTKKNLKVQHDRMATKQIMRFQEQQRKKLEKRKHDEKEAALNEVFGNSGNIKIEHDSKKWDEKGSKALQQLEMQEQEERKRIAEEKKKAKQKKYVQQLHEELQERENEKNKNTMFTEEDIQGYEDLRNKVQEEIQIEEVPIRKETKVNMKFTEKVYPHVAAREHHYTDPPMPKDKNQFAPPEGDIENRNPLWLKDKGDRFMHDRNYSAAIDVYTETLKIDQSQIKAKMNRSLAHMKSLNLDSAINDCDSILLQMQKQLVNNQDNKEESLKDLIKIKTRKALCLAWKGKFQQAKQILQEQLKFDVGGKGEGEEETKAQIQDCLKSIENRETSLELKLKADEKFKRNLHEEAIKIYDQSIEIDNNEYALANKCLCLIKLDKFSESIEIADEGITIIEQFSGKGHKKTTTNVSNTSNSQLTSNLLLKLLYRKSKALQSSNNFKQAETTLLKAININPEDKDIKQALKSLQNKQNTQTFYTLKQEASTLVKNSSPKQALKIYQRCLKLLESMNQNHQEYLSVLQNQCVCFLKLEEYDSIIATSIRILNIVNNIKGKIVEFGENRAANTPSKEELNKISIRTLIRRANAYLKTNQIYNAKSDLQKAAQIDPADPNVKKELEKLKKSLQTSQ